MGYGSVGRFQQELVHMATHGVGRGANVGALGDQKVPIRAISDLDVIGSFVSELGAEFDEEKYAAYVGSKIHAREVYIDCGIRYTSIDMNQKDGAVPIDLNEIPKENALGDSFDIVTNYGTTEHVSSQISAYAWIHYLLKPGGLIFIALPLFHFSNHAMNLVTPFFFKKLVDGNGYQILEAKLTLTPTINGLAFHYGKELQFLEGFSELVEHSPFAAQTWIVLKKANDAAFVPPLDIDLTNEETLCTMRSYIWRYGEMYSERQKELAMQQFAYRESSPCEEYIREKGEFSLNRAHMKRISEVVTFLKDTRSLS